MNTLKEIQNSFTSIGGKFITPIETLKEKADKTNCFFFDWDGVFSYGEKNYKYFSSFYEADSLGINMLRFSKWYITKKIMPFVIITGGKNNKTCDFFSEREKFNSIYRGALHKIEAANHFKQNQNVNIENSFFIFDDVLDLSLAKKSGFRVWVKRNSQPAFENYIIKNNLVDYITGNTSGNTPIREACELIICLLNLYNKILDLRLKYDGEYKEYLSERQKTSLDKYIYSKSKFILN